MMSIDDVSTLIESSIQRMLTKVFDMNGVIYGDYVREKIVKPALDLPTSDVRLLQVAFRTKECVQTFEHEYGRHFCMMNVAVSKAQFDHDRLLVNSDFVFDGKCVYSEGPYTIHDHMRMLVNGTEPDDSDDGHLPREDQPMVPVDRLCLRTAEETVQEMLTLAFECNLKLVGQSLWQKLFSKTSTSIELFGSAEDFERFESRIVGRCVAGRRNPITIFTRDAENVKIFRSTSGVRYLDVDLLYFDGQHIGKLDGCDTSVQDLVVKLLSKRATSLPNCPQSKINEMKELGWTIDDSFVEPIVKILDKALSVGAHVNRWLGGGKDEVISSRADVEKNVNASFCIEICADYEEEKFDAIMDFIKSSGWSVKKSSHPCSFEYVIELNKSRLIIDYSWP